MKQNKNDELGVVLILAPVIVTLMLMFLGWFLDVSYENSRRSMAQASADAAAFGAASFLTGGGTDAQSIEVGKSIGMKNLGELSSNCGTVNDCIRLAITRESEKIVVESEALARFDYLLSPVMLGAATRRVVNASASIKIRPLAVAIAFDLSSSMCAELSPEIGDTNCPRMRESKQAIKELINFLDPSRDYLSITCFGTERCGSPSMPPVPLPMQDSPFNRAEALKAVERLKLFSNPNDYYAWTNTEAGLKSGKDELEKVTASTLTKRIMIVVTDGSPAHPNHSFTTMMDRAIIESDELRRKQITIVGLGIGDKQAPVGSDPYQLNTSGIKGVFMRRLTYDIKADDAKDPEFYSRNNSIPSYSMLHLRNIPRGKFIFTTDGSFDQPNLYKSLVVEHKILMIE
jgi:hypothetical protein